MTKLTGSEKQIKWAMDIKSKMQADFDKFKDMMKDSEAAIKAIKFVENIEAAKFWIDNRNFDVAGLLTLFGGQGLSYRGDECAEIAKVSVDGKITLSKRTL